VDLVDELGACAPRLCRYARALIAGRPGPCEAADALARAVLVRMREAGTSAQLARSDLRLHLFSLLTEWNRERMAAGRLRAKGHAEEGNFHIAPPPIAGKRPICVSNCGELGHSLLDLALEEREALLLVVLEGFSYAQAARILKISRRALIARLARARTLLGETPAKEFLARPAKARPSYLRVVK
jgi:RNA polymerase sigma-70 factor, ECF subfamily